MLLYLTQYLSQFESGFNVFNYLTMRAILGALTALVICFVLGPRMIERLKQVGHNEPLDEVVRRHDQVIAGIAAAEFREQLFVVRKKVVLNVYSGRCREVRERGLTNIGVPVVEVHRAALCLKRFRQREAQAHSANALKRGTAAKREVRSFHLSSP